MNSKEFLMSIGDSIVLVADEDIVKVHVHTNDPGKAISRALTYGALTRMKIDNMREEHQEKLIKDAEKLAAQQAEEEKKKEPKKECGFISVSIGEGIGEIFKGLGVDCLIEGGQTMNPSTEDMLSAIDKVNAENVFIFPNNKNVILAANQAKVLTKDKKIFVIPTKTVPQGITAVINYNPDRTPEENEASMMEEIQHVKTGEVTYAVRDTHIDDKEIHEGDFMGIGDHSILSVGKNLSDVTKDMLAAMADDDSELISIYYGADIDEETANALGDEIMVELYSGCDVEIYSGGQPIYLLCDLCRVERGNEMNEMSPIDSLKGIGEKTRAVFERAGISDIGDLLHDYPRGYESYEPIMPLGEIYDKNAGGFSQGRLSLP